MMRPSKTWIVLLSLGLSAALAERLPIKTYTSADGLGIGEVKQIVSDSHGFLWFCTQNGLSRFDGSRFVNFHDEKPGGPLRSVNDFLEIDGEYWIASNGEGIWRMKAAALLSETSFQAAKKGQDAPGGSQLRQYLLSHDNPAANRVNALYRDRSGAIWAGSDAGLFRIDGPNSTSGFTRVELRLASNPDRVVQVWAFAPDPEGGFWLGTKFGLVRMLPDGRIVQYRIRPARGMDNVYCLWLDPKGSLWVGHQAGLLVLALPVAFPKEDRVQDLIRTGSSQVNLLMSRRISLPVQPGSSQWFTVGEISQLDVVGRVRGDSDGNIWIATWGHGLIRLHAGEVRVYTTANGLSRNGPLSLGEDAAGSLWIGGLDAMRLDRNGFVGYDGADGFGSAKVSSIFRDREGTLYAIGDGWRINQLLEARRFVSIRPNLPASLVNSTWRFNQSAIKDHLGDWWFATGDGLYRFGSVPRLELLSSKPPLRYTGNDGIPQNDLTQLFEDSRGDIWIGYFAPHHAVVTRWERSTGRFHSYSEADGLPLSVSALQFLEDHAGGVWVIFREGGAARYREGAFRLFGASEGWPAGDGGGGYLDRRGSLWIFNYGTGITRVENPAADKLSITQYTTQEGLASNKVLRGTEDDAGRLYLATLSGIDRLDPVTGQIRHYIPSNGLVSSVMYAALSDSDGGLWFGNDQGLWRYDAVVERNAPSAPVFITGLTIAGIPHEVHRFAVPDTTLLELGASRNQLRFDFIGLSLFSGDRLRYQYRLEGGVSEWSAPSAERSVTFASLAPGKYRFAVRAINGDGVVSPREAAFAFTVLAPFWWRWWFLTLCLAAAMAAIYAVHRYHLSNALALERVRTRIATDLHDDIGSSLTQIAILSEVARRGERQENLSRIAAISRELVDSMSDIVWTINPQKDSIEDLVWRMRQFAGEMFVARDIALTFQTPHDCGGMRLGAELRRHVFLVFKECVNNAVRHSTCTQAGIELVIEHHALRLAVSENGCGFDLEQLGVGHGLASMKMRAGKIGGRLEIDTSDRGTVVTLRAPLS